LKEYQQAADTLERQIRQDPTQILAHFYLSRAYSALGRTADAQHEAELHRRMLEQASTAAPAGDELRQDAVWNQARQELSEDHEAQALELFRSSAQDPDEMPGGPYVFVGALYLNLGRSDDAARALHQALQLEPGVRGAHTYLGLLALEQNDLEAAEREFKAELARDPNDSAATAELGEVRYRQGRWADAADQLSRSHTTAPGLLYLLADAYFRLGKVKDADLTAELAVDYARHQPELIQRVVDLLNRNQQPELGQKLAAKLPS
jgi:tetratricopeptide (TPR) repeat protein